MGTGKVPRIAINATAYLSRNFPIKGDILARLSFEGVRKIKANGAIALNNAPGRNLTGIRLRTSIF